MKNQLSIPIPRGSLWGTKLHVIIVVLFFTLGAKAQIGPLYLTWDYSVGCIEGQNDENRKNYFELIENGDCLTVCKSNPITFTLNEDIGEWTSVDWTVLGGTFSPSTSSPYTCTITWSNSASVTNGSVSAIVHTANSGDIILPPFCINLLKGPKAEFFR